jgi:hypothetical protein
VKGVILERVVHFLGESRYGADCTPVAAHGCVTYMEVGEGRELGAASFTYMEVGEGRELGAASF